MPSSMQLRDLVAEGRVELAAQVDEPLVLVGQQRQQLALVAAQQRRQPRRHGHGVLDQHRVGEHRGRLLGDRQLDAPAVGDGAAAGRDLQVLDLLGGRALGQGVGLDRAQPGRAHGGQAQKQEEDGEEESDPAVEEGRPHGLLARLGCRLGHGSGRGRRRRGGLRHGALGLGRLLCRRFGRRAWWPGASCPPPPAPARSRPARPGRAEPARRRWRRRRPSGARARSWDRRPGWPSGSAPRRRRAGPARARPPRSGSARWSPAGPGRRAGGRSRA